MTAPLGYQPIPEAAVRALQEMHPDPFVQAAVWRTFCEAPGLLDAAPYVTLAAALGRTSDQIMHDRHNRKDR